MYLTIVLNFVKYAAKQLPKTSLKQQGDCFMESATKCSGTQIIARGKFISFQPTLVG